MKYSKKGCAAPRKMADGGSVGFLERLKAGNIDDPSSEAYNRWGAGSKTDESSAETARLARSTPTKSESESSVGVESAKTDVADGDTSAGSLPSPKSVTPAKAAPAKPKPAKQASRPAPTTKMASQSFGGGLADGLARGRDASNKAAERQREGDDEHFYERASKSDPANGFLGRVGSTLGKVGDWVRNGTGPLKLANGGKVGGDAQVGGARSYGKK